MDNAYTFSQKMNQPALVSLDQSLTHWKRQFYIGETGVTPARFILAAGSIHSRRAEALRAAGFDVIEPEEEPEM